MSPLKLFFSYQLTFSVFLTFETLHNIYSLFLLRKKAYKTEISTD